MQISAVDLEVVKASLSGIVQEMQNSLFRTGFSTIVRESQDASCALMNTRGEIIAQHVVLPLHIGAFPACCAAVLAAYAGAFADGDAFIINHPYEGGSPHAPDMCVITPVFHGGALFGFCGSIAHKSDIGGPVPGSCSGQARETFNEGLHLPALRYQVRHEQNTDIERLIAANSRTPELVLGDIRGQLGSCRLGERRVDELLAKYGRGRVEACCARLFELGEAKVRAAIAEWADGRYEAERFVDDDGVDLGKPVRIHVVAEKQGDRLHFDLSGSADQTRGPANIRPPLVRASIAYCLISMIDPHMYVSSGLLSSYSFDAREGSVLNPRFPAPVNTYNPTIHALVDAIFQALAPIVPDKIRADGSGSRSIIIGGRATSTGKGYVQYEIVGGGAGARATKDGMSGTCMNQSNAKIAPVEIIESEFPVRMLRFELIRDSGGPGLYRGGLGIRREYANLADARFSIRSTKHVIPPNGFAGGQPGRTGDILINPDTAGEKRLPTRYADYPLKAGDVFRLDTPGGGGYGEALAREPARVLDDVIEGVVSPEGAAREYGVVVKRNGARWTIDEAATAAQRHIAGKPDNGGGPVRQSDQSGDLP
jgi:N-methylhydantoinase B